MGDIISSNNKRLAKNTMALYFRTLISTLVSLYTVRALLDALGAADYGIYNVVGSIVVTFSFFNSTLRSAIQRFMNVALGRDDKEEFAKVFSLSNIIMLGLIIFIIILSETVGLWFLNNKLDIPGERFESAQIAFQFTIITFCLGVIRIPLESSVIAYERMTFFAYLSILEQALKLLVVYALYHTTNDKLIVYAFLLSITSLVTLIAYMIFCKKSFDTCKYKLIFDKTLFKSLFTFSGWTFLGATTDLGTRQAFVFLLNNFYGVVANAAMGIANQVVNTVNSLIVGFQTSFRPQLVKSYAQGNMEYVTKLIYSSSKISFLLMFLPGILLIINAPFILGLWLKEIPEYTVSFCRLILACSVIDATTGPYYATLMATGNIKKYQVWISLVFCLDIVFICIMFVCGVGAEYILYSRILTRGVMNMFVGLFFLKRQLSFKISSYLKNVIFPILIYILVLLPFIYLMMKFMKGLQLFIISDILILTIGILLPYKVVLDNKERSLIKSMLLLKLFKK